MNTEAVREQELRTFFDTLYAAWTANDAEALAALYTDEATVAMPGVFNHGREVVRAYMAAAFAGPLRGSRAIDEPTSIRFIGNETAIVVSEAGILMAGETTVPAERLHRATWTLTKDDGAWKVAAYPNCAKG